jgi:hypothetical protein
LLGGKSMAERKAGERLANRVNHAPGVREPQGGE